MTGVSGVANAVSGRKGARLVLARSSFVHICVRIGTPARIAVRALNSAAAKIATPKVECANP